VQVIEDPFKLQRGQILRLGGPDVRKDVVGKLAVTLRRFRRAVAFHMFPEPFVQERREHSRIRLDEIAVAVFIEPDPQRIIRFRLPSASWPASML